MFRVKVVTSAVIVGILFFASAANASSNREIAVRLFDRLAGYIAPSDPRLNEMEAKIAVGDFEGAAHIATQDPKFGDDTLFRYYVTMCDRNRDAATKLNDCVLTGIGITWKEMPEHRIAGEPDYNYASITTANVIFESSATGLPTRNAGANGHYDTLFDNRFTTSYVGTLRAVSPQRTTINNVAWNDPAGLITTDTFWRVHADAGTNRRIVQYILEEFMLFGSIDRMKDASLDIGRVRQDVDRKPGNNPMTFQQTCRTCHAHLDPMTSAFNRYDVNGTTPRYNTGVSGKITQRELNPLNFPGFQESTNSPVDSFLITSTSGVNSALGWKTTSGTGAAGVGQAVASSAGFKLAAVKRAWKVVCLRDHEPGEEGKLERLADQFDTTLGFKLTKLMEVIAVQPECLGR